MMEKMKENKNPIFGFAFLSIKIVQDPRWELVFQISLQVVCSTNPPNTLAVENAAKLGKTGEPVP